MGLMHFSLKFDSCSTLVRLQFDVGSASESGSGTGPAKNDFWLDRKILATGFFKKKPTKLFYGKNVKNGTKVPVRRRMIVHPSRRALSVGGRYATY